jgi:hypothetical protein
MSTSPLAAIVSNLVREEVERAASISESTELINTNVNTTNISIKYNATQPVNFLHESDMTNGWPAAEAGCLANYFKEAFAS